MNSWGKHCDLPVLVASTRLVDSPECRSSQLILDFRKDPMTWALYLSGLVREPETD